MASFKELYFKLAGRLANAIDTLDNVSQDLKEAQQQAEDAFIASEDAPLIVLEPTKMTDKDEEISPKK